MSTLTTFYKNYVRLCAEKGVSASAAAESVGLSRTSPNGWKSGKNPSDTTLAKLAAYFGVNVDDLILEQKEKPATETGDGRDEKTRILLELFSQADEQRRQEMINYAQYLLNQQNNNN